MKYFKITTMVKCKTHLTLICFGLLFMSCTSFKQIDTGASLNDQIEEQLKPGERMRLILMDETQAYALEKDTSLMLNVIKVDRVSERTSYQISGKYYFLQQDSLNLTAYVKKQQPGGSYIKKYFCVDKRQVAFIEKQKFSVGKTMGFTGLMLGVSVLYFYLTFDIGYSATY